jgi:hypothetical protein
MQAFAKVEKEGKGWLWGIKEGVPIERERKKKTPPPQVPPNQAQTYYPHGQHPYPPYQGYPPHSGAPGYHGAPAYGPPRHHPPAASLIPPSLAQPLKPPPSLAQPSNGANSQQTQTYSSPYAKDASKPGESSTSQPQPPRQSPYQTYPPSGSHPPTSHPGNSSHSASPYQTHPQPYRSNAHASGQPSNSTTPPVPPGQSYSSGAPPSRPRYNRPSEDVIETFKRVFIQSMQSRKDQSIGAGKAEEIVSKAIRRVLEPDYMANVPPEPQEEAVTKAFEKIVIQSQSPPRQSMPGQQATTVPTPAIASSAAATAAMTAAATAGVSNGQPSSSGSRPVGPPPVPQQQAPTAPMHQQPQPQRPAESVLMNMLMAGPGQARSASPAVPPQQAAPPPAGTKSTSPTTAVPVVLAAATGSTPTTTTAPAQTAPSTTTTQLPASANTNVDLSRVNGVLKDLPQVQLARANGTATPTRPAIEPLTPPVLGSPKMGGKRAISPQNEDGNGPDGTGKRIKVGNGPSEGGKD